MQESGQRPWSRPCTLHHPCQATAATSAHIAHGMQSPYHMRCVKTDTVAADTPAALASHRPMATGQQQVVGVVMLPRVAGTVPDSRRRNPPPKSLDCRSAKLTHRLHLQAIGQWQRGSSRWWAVRDGLRPSRIRPMPRSPPPEYQPSLEERSRNTGQFCASEGILGFFPIWGTPGAKGGGGVIPNPNTPPQNARRLLLGAAGAGCWRRAGSVGLAAPSASPRPPSPWRVRQWLGSPCWACFATPSESVVLVEIWVLVFLI